MLFCRGWKRFLELKRSSPATPNAAPTRIKMPIETGFAFLLIGRNRAADGFALHHDMERAVDCSENSPRLRKALTFASGECSNSSLGFPCASIVLDSASRKIESSAMVKMLGNSWVTTTMVAP